MKLLIVSKPSDCSIGFTNFCCANYIPFIVLLFLAGGIIMVPSGDVWSLSLGIVTPESLREYKAGVMNFGALSFFSWMLLLSDFRRISLFRSATFFNFSCSFCLFLALICSYIMLNIEGNIEAKTLKSFKANLAKERSVCPFIDLYRRPDLPVIMAISPKKEFFWRVAMTTFSSSE